MSTITHIKTDEGIVVVTNERLDNDNFVNIRILRDKKDVAEIDVPIDELMGALIGFDSQRSRRIALDNERQ